MFPAFITGATAVISGANTLKNAFSGKDAERAAATDAAYTAAIAGNSDALEFLKYRTGDYGEKYISAYDGIVGGWGSGTAREYAKQKYQQALLTIKGSGFVEQAKDAIQDAAQKTGNTIVPGTKQEIGMGLVIGGIALAGAVWFIATKRKAA